MKIKKLLRKILFIAGVPIHQDFNGKKVLIKRDEDKVEFSNGNYIVKIDKNLSEKLFL